MGTTTDDLAVRNSTERRPASLLQRYARPEEANRLPPISARRRPVPPRICWRSAPTAVSHESVQSEDSGGKHYARRNNERRRQRWPALCKTTMSRARRKAPCPPHGDIVSGNLSSAACGISFYAAFPPPLRSLTRGWWCGRGGEHHQSHDRASPTVLPLRVTSISRTERPPRLHELRLRRSMQPRLLVIWSSSRSRPSARWPRDVLRRQTLLVVGHLPARTRLAMVMVCAGFSGERNAMGASASSRILASLTSMGRMMPSSTSTWGCPCRRSRG